MAYAMASSELTIVILDRDVDSGLDESESSHSTSPATDEDLELRKDRALSIKNNGYFNPVNSGPTSNSELSASDDVDVKKEVAHITNVPRSYFKSPLELELEKKLALIRSNGTLLMNIQRNEAKNLAIARASLETELQTTRDVWKSLYFDSKAKTIPLDEQVQTKKNTLDNYRDGILRKMKTKVVERSKQRQTSDAMWRKRNLLQRRESCVNKHGRTKKISPLDVNRKLLQDDFSLKLEAIKMENLAQKTEEVRGRVQKVRLNLAEAKQDNRSEQCCIEELRKELKALQMEADQG